jgi:hypothetical protein
MAKKQTKNTVDEQALMKSLGVDKLWKNSKGEYFTSENFALMSEANDKAKVQVVNYLKPAEEVTETANENTKE